LVERYSPALYVPAKSVRSLAKLGETARDWSVFSVIPVLAGLHEPPPLVDLNTPPP
jgi:hypothetical protein